MVFGAFILFFVLACFLLTRDVSLNIKKDTKFEFRLTILHLDFYFRQKAKYTNKKNDKRKSLPLYLKLLRRNAKTLRKATVTITKIACPYQYDVFSVDSFLLPYDKYALICSIISFLDSQVKRLDLKDDAVCVSQSISSLCLDITVKIKLFYALSLLFDYLMLSTKEQKKGRKNAYVR